jgi:hypothetical protein
MAKEVVEEKIPWHFLIPFIVLVGFLGEWWNATNTLSYPAVLGITVICYAALTSLPFICFYFAGAFGRLLKRRVDATILTWLYAAALPISFVFGRADVNQMCSSIGPFISHRIFNPPEFTYSVIPWYMGPPVDVAKAIVRGGVPVPWADLMPMIIFWWIFWSLWGLLMVSIATIFRRQWMDVEKVPFMHADAAHRLLVNVVTTPKERVAKGAVTPFWMGVIIGFIAWIPRLLLDIFPWFPDIYGWRANTCGFGSWWVPAGHPLASLAGFSRAGKEPLGVALMYLAPLHVLFGIWFWYLIMLIMAQIAFYMGYYTGITDIGGCGRIWCGEGSLNYGPPIAINAIVLGGIWSLTILLLISSRHHIINTVKAAFGRMGVTKRTEFEKGEPMSYRGIYAFAIVIFIATVAICMMTGMSVASSVLTIIAISVTWFSQMRTLGLGGVYFRDADKGAPLQRLLFWPETPADYTTNRDYLMTAHLGTWMVDAPDMGFSVGGNFFSAFLGYKMASFTGVSTKSVFKVLVASIVLGTLAAMLGFFQAAYTFGLGRISGSGGIIGCNSLVERGVRPSDWIRYPASGFWYPQFLAGFIMILILGFLHARYIWFPLEPIGFITGVGVGFGWWGFWTYGLVAWILKTITLRVGGSKLYEEWGAPIASGFIAGHMLALIPGTIISKIRWFYPF